jgi:hypothetical protein
MKEYKTTSVKTNIPKPKANSSNNKNNSILKTPTDLKSQILTNLLEKKTSFNIKNISKKTTTSTKNESSLNIVRPLSATNISIGERLYMKGLASLDKSTMKVKQIRQAKEDQFYKTCTFSPRLNNSSVYINLRKVYSPKSVKISKSKSIDQKDIKPNTPSVMRKVKSEKEIRAVSEKMYQRANTLNNKKENMRNRYYSEVCTFKPDIRDKSQPDVNKFFSRLQNWIEKTNEQFHTQQEQNFFDRKTGQKLFRPQILNSVSFFIK